MTRVLVAGSANTDMVVRVPRIPRPGETVLGGAFAMAAGGKGANQAVAAARAGARVTFVARVGDDLFGRQALEGFSRDGIETRFVRATPGAATGIALITVDERGENSISVASGANALLAAADIDAAAEAFGAADVVLLQLESPLETVEAAARAAKERGVPVILNPAPARELGDGLLSLVTVLTPNEHEAKVLEIKARADALGETLLELVDKDIAVYSEVTAAYKLPRATAEEKAARQQAIQALTVEIFTPHENPFDFSGIPNIFQRIAADQDHGCRLPFIDTAESISQPHEFCREDRRAAQDVLRREAGILPSFHFFVNGIAGYDARQHQVRSDHQRHSGLVQIDDHLHPIFPDKFGEVGLLGPERRP